MRLIDFGNALVIPKCKIFAAIASLTHYWQQPFGIRFVAPELLPCRADHSVMFIDATVQIRIGPLLADGIYTVQLVDNATNNNLVGRWRSQMKEIAGT